MSEIIPFAKTAHPSGFTSGQFRKLDGLYLKAASAKTLTYRTVECDFDEGIASYTYYKSAHYSAYLSFVIRKVGPHTTMYEIYLQQKGRIMKSGIFEKAFHRLEEEIEKLLAQ
ncbi:MAG: hypothetical protein CBB87_05285 [Micavibrio sp. TMED27]|nr:hypothetical protein [Micavibrio sp.]OUT91439.1 MAG: hypothetical protein CBB87_05285 [Micavibrio sp. TMED27]|tara:strand:- start:630 stop:968 length:339 start_codon:yes stop_codon:yes gene_type:complete